MTKLYFVDRDIGTEDTLECANIERETKCFYFVDKYIAYNFTNRVDKKVVNKKDYFTSPDAALKDFADRRRGALKDAEKRLYLAKRAYHRALVFAEENESKF